MQQVAASKWEGSSPRMRGAHHVRKRREARLGIIPAYAGSTSPRSAAAARCGDHPRVCGEHEMGFACGKCCVGSSPRMRGARAWSRPPQSGRRIIPAYAGSTSCRARTRASGRDHPRVCGEHHLADLFPPPVAQAGPRRVPQLGYRVGVAVVESDEGLDCDLSLFGAEHAASFLSRFGPRSPPQSQVESQA